MCGICGIFLEDGLPPVSEQLLASMRDAMQHRGPDAAGLWLEPQGRLGLAHRRLSLVDLSAASNQPMSDEQQNVVVVFNGEIYNHLALRRELSGAGHRFKTEHSDTEVLVHGYKAWGWDGLLQRLRGMFAIALWDADNRQLFLARDRVGIKPLYVHAAGGRLLFASEIKAILQARDVTRAIDPAAMYHYLSGMVAPAPMTMFRGIQKLPAGCYLQVDARGKIRFQRYWNAAMEASTPAPSREATVRSVRNAFDASVAEHMAADVPVGVLLSGGVDSTAILAGMAANASGPVHSFSVGYDDFPDLDERQHARDMARHFGAEHHEIAITRNSFEQAWEDIVRHQDEPLADWVCVPLYYVSRLAATQTKAVLVGEGADELFAGYGGYLRYLKLYQQVWSPYRDLVPRPVRSIVGALARHIGHGRLARSAGLDFLMRASGNGECFWGGAATFWELQKNSLLHHGAIDAAILVAGEGPIDDNRLRIPDSNVVIRDAASTAGDGRDDQLRRMLDLELAFRLPELLLMRVDKMTMAHSIEARVPFLDHRLVSAAHAIPTAWKLHGNQAKSIFKDAVRGLIPDRVIDRPKVGFGAPVMHWLRGDFGRRIEDEVRHSPLINNGWFNLDYIGRMFQAHREGRGDFATNLWTLYNLTSWHARWIEAQPGS